MKLQEILYVNAQLPISKDRGAVDTFAILVAIRVGVCPYTAA